MSRRFTPSPRGYRKVLAQLTAEVKEGVEACGGPVPFRAKISALNAITKAAAVDRQLEDLIVLHETIKQLQAKVAELTTAQADERHNSAARIDGEGDAEPCSG